MAIGYSSQLGLTAVGSIYVSVGLVANVNTQQQGLERGEDVWAARLIKLTRIWFSLRTPRKCQYKQGFNSV